MKNKYLILSMLVFSSQTLFGGGNGESTENNVYTKASAVKNIERVVDTQDSKIKISFASFWYSRYYNSIDFTEARTFNNLMQTIINRINLRPELGYLEVNQGIDLNRGYYQELDKVLQNPELNPDMYLISSANLGKYYINGYVEELYNANLVDVKIDVKDWTSGIRELASVDNHIYGIPIGQDLLVWYVNIDIFKEVGLLDAKGNPILPTSYEEMVEQANKVQEITGKPYIGVDFLGMNATRFLLSAMWQYGVNILEKTSQGRQVVFNSFSSRLVGTEMQNFFYEGNNYVRRGQSTVGLQQDFIDGKVAVLVDTLSARELLYRGFSDRFEVENAELISKLEQEATNTDVEIEIDIPSTKDYAYISSFPKIYDDGSKTTKYATVWGVTNLLVVRRGLRLEDYIKYNAILEIFKSIHDSDLEWAKQGLTPVQYSSLEEEIYSNNNTTQMGNAIIQTSDFLILRDKNIFRHINLKDIPLSNKYSESMLALQSMTNDILIRKINVKTALTEVHAKLLDLMIKEKTFISDE